MRLYQNEVSQVIANKSECPKNVISKAHFFPHYLSWQKEKKMYHAFSSTPTQVYCIIHRQRKNWNFFGANSLSKVLLSTIRLNTKLSPLY